MKRYILFYTLFWGLASLTLAQQPQARFQLLRERIATAKFEYISEKLALSDEQANQFKPLYLAFEREQMQLGALKKLRINNVNADSISDEEAQNLMTARFDFVQKQLDLRRKYYAEYQKVLTPQQIIKLQQAEAEIRQKVLMELRNRKQNANLQ
jgi:Spy/CpxP family protein refolding chaperone